MTSRENSWVSRCSVVLVVSQQIALLTPCLQSSSTNMAALRYKYEKNEDSSTSFPTLEDFLSLRTKPEIMKIFAGTFLSCVVGRVAFRRKSANVELQEFVTKTDEAFALLCIENIYDRFVKIDINTWYAPHQEGKRKRNCKSGKYTEDAHKAHRYGGWNQKGMSRFNELCKIVELDRDANKEWEEKYKRERYGAKMKERYGMHTNADGTSGVTVVVDDL